MREAGTPARRCPPVPPGDRLPRVRLRTTSSQSWYVRGGRHHRPVAAEQTSGRSEDRQSVSQEGLTASTLRGPATISVISPESLQAMLGMAASSVICRASSTCPHRREVCQHDRERTAHRACVGLPTTSPSLLRMQTSKVSSRSASMRTPSRNVSVRAKPGPQRPDQPAHAYHQGECGAGRRGDLALGRLLQRGRRRRRRAGPRKVRLPDQPGDFRYSLGVVAVCLHGDEFADGSRGRPQERRVHDAVQLRAHEPRVSQPTGIPQVHMRVENSRGSR